MIGLPGETISLSGGRVYINGHVLPEPWLPPATRTETYPGPSTAPYALHRAYKIPADDVYVMGDNRTQSCDSRYWGPVPESTIVGQGRHAHLAPVATRLLLIRHAVGARVATPTRRPDQVSSMAHTLLSTRPSGSATSRTTPSCMVVSSPEARLGQATHRPPEGKIMRDSGPMRRSKSRRCVKKATTTSAEPRAWRFTVTPGGRPSMTPRGAAIRASVEPSVIPSFLGSGVPL